MTTLHASLPMYDLAELQEHTDALWSAIRSALFDQGVHAPRELQRNLPPLHDHWLDPSLLLSHTCGYPAVTVLDGRINVVGSWATIVDEPEHPGWYRSVVVARHDDLRTDDMRAYAGSGLRLCANGPASLSGWVSLGFFCDQAGIADDLLANEVSVRITGSHAASLEAIQQGHADVASIDALSFALFGSVRPSATAGLRIIGRGPAVAVTPLFTAIGGPLAEIRYALKAVATDDSMQPTLQALGIVGFQPHGLDAHDPVRDLAVRHEPTIGLLHRQTA